MLHKKVIAAAVAALFSFNVGVVNAMSMLPAVEDMVSYSLVSVPFKVIGKVADKGTKGKLSKIEAAKKKAKNAKKNADSAKDAKNKFDDMKQKKGKKNENPFGSKEKAKVKKSQTQRVFVDPDEAENSAADFNEAEQSNKTEQE